MNASPMYDIYMIIMNASPMYDIYMIIMNASPMYDIYMNIMNASPMYDIYMIITLEVYIRRIRRCTTVYDYNECVFYVTFTLRELEGVQLQVKMKLKWLMLYL